MKRRAHDRHRRHRNFDDGPGALPDVGPQRPQAFAERTANAVEERILRLGPENVAAFIGEPVQGAGGVIIPPDGYWPRVEMTLRSAPAASRRWMTRSDLA